ncbi:MULTISPECIES: hypothetical protein [unclassified Sphingobium]|jgi:hypothetical protein|uniref:hypothetical protein n=1 Tax=unclassified Sphingobium TaxID=2611147 RepID=UPI000B22EBA9|nr:MULTISPECIES: hypothetical protein [unclassified Sphingobium]WIW89146.1 hypothetical protein K3M67_03985 [Sphingobium sp. V4]
MKTIVLSLAGSALILGLSLSPFATSASARTIRTGAGLPLLARAEVIATPLPDCR